MGYEEKLYAIEKGEVIKGYNGDILTAEEVSSRLSNELELVEKAMDKQGYLENRLDELGGIKFSKDNIKVGYIVTTKRLGKVEVVSTGPLNFTYKDEIPGPLLKAAYAEIEEIVSAVEKKKAYHPFKVGEQFNAEIYEDSKRCKVVYEIVKASKTKIWLKRTDGKDDVITREPRNVSGKRWQFRIDSRPGNTFCKDAS